MSFLSKIGKGVSGILKGATNAVSNFGKGVLNGDINSLMTVASIFVPALAPLALGSSIGSLLTGGGSGTNSMAQSSGSPATSVFGNLVDPAKIARDNFLNLATNKTEEAATLGVGTDLLKDVFKFV